MTDRDKIAYLQELATSHYNDGNLAAAVASWRQLLEIDPANVAARQGITLAEARMEGGPVPSESGGDDADATMMFNPEASPFGGGPFGGAPQQPFDADRTMAFNPGGGFPGPAQSPFGAPPAQPAAPFGGPEPGFDADRTMMFNPAAPAAPAAPAPAPAGGFDAERTMMFQPAPQAAAPRAPAAPAPQGGGGFDADKTMLFGTPAPAAPAAAPPASPDFDADRTMLFGGAPAAAPQAPPAPEPSPFSFGAPPAAPAPTFAPPPAAAPPAPTFAPPPAAPAFAPPPAAPTFAPPPAAPGSDWLGGSGAAPEADQTQLSPDDFPPPPAQPAAPSFVAPPPSATRTGDRQLEDFVMPTDGLQMPATPASAPSFDLPSPGGLGAKPPASAGFSFELPPPPAKGGSAFDLPDLPSVGLPPPPTFAPPPPPPPVAVAPKKSAAQFGEVEAGEAEALAVPTIGLNRESHDELPEPGTPEAATREEELRRQYEQQYGRSTVGSPMPRPTSTAPKPKSRLGIYIIVALVALLGAAWVVIKYVIPTEAPPVENIPVKVDPNAGMKPEEIVTKLSTEASELLAAGRLEDAEKKLAEARVAAAKANITIPPRLEQLDDAVADERAFQAAFTAALKSFCLGDYSAAHVQFVELEVRRPQDKRAGEYLERIYYNVGIEQLQTKVPWDAEFYFEKLLARNPGDKEAEALLAYSRQFKPGSQLDYAYTSRVDPLVDRTQGCERR